MSFGAFLCHYRKRLKWLSMTQLTEKGCHRMTSLVPRAGARELVAIVYSWWLSKVLSIKWLIESPVYPNNERKMRPNATKF